METHDANHNKMKCYEQLHVSVVGQTLDTCSFHDIKTHHNKDKHGNNSLGAVVTDHEIPRKSREGAVLRTGGQK